MTAPELDLFTRKVVLDDLSGKPSKSTITFRNVGEDGGVN